MGWVRERMEPSWGSVVRLGMLLIAAIGAVAAPAALAGTPARAPSRNGGPTPSSARTTGPVPALNVIPFPGTPDASPASQIIFSGLPRSDLLWVNVSGSRSGRHAGQLSALPGGAGTAFLPHLRFTPGEQVSVTALVRASAPRSAAADSGATRLRFSFSVAVSAGAADRTAGAADGAPPAASATRGAWSARWQIFQSQPHLHPPLVDLASGRARAAGDVFLTPHNAGQTGAMIVNGRGQLVWFRRTGRLTPFNLELQHYRGKPVLTWWQGHVRHGHGVDGQDVILDSSYRTVAVLQGGYGYSSDLHEFQLMPHGRALIDAVVPVHASETSVGGPSDGVVVDNVIQMLDIRTGRVLWEWHALGHVPMSATYNWVPSDQFPLDYFHINSIQALPDGKLIISARNTWAVYMIDEHTGRVLWTLGGKYSSFSMGSGTNFEWQHDARLHRRGILTLFDDAAAPAEESESSAKVMRIDSRAGSVSLVRRITHAPGVLAGSQGSAQLLSNGNVFVGWGSAPDFSEYSPSGHQIFDGHFRIGVNSYRAYLYRWIGRPATRPSLAVSRGRGGSVRVFASWNGATQVAAWKVLGGATRKTLEPRGRAPATRFETTIRVRGRPRLVALDALGRRGRVLGRSPVIPSRNIHR